MIDQYIAYLRVSTSFRKGLTTALIYPSILVVAVIVILTYLITYAMPNFAKLYGDSGILFPAITQLMLDIARPFALIFRFSSLVWLFLLAASIGSHVRSAAHSLSTV